MAVEFSSDSLRVFREAGLADGYIDALRKPVESLLVMGAEAVDAKKVDDALAKVEADTRRLRSALRAIDEHASARSQKAVAGFLLEEELALAFPEDDDPRALLVGSALDIELARVGRLLEAIQHARKNGRERFGRRRGRPKRFDGVRPIFNALHRHWTSNVGRGDPPSFLNLTHAVNSPFRSVVDACYWQAGLPNGAPDNLFEEFVTSQKALTNGAAAAIGRALARSRKMPPH